MFTRHIRMWSFYSAYNLPILHQILPGGCEFLTIRGNGTQKENYNFKVP